MRIWINDKQLDTYEGSVNVTKTNNLWKLGKAEFVHTQTVKIPATNNNKALLDFADEFRTQSSVARGFVDCLVDIDGVFEQGRLYVSGYSDGEFSVIITFGKELRSLDVKLVDAIKDSVMPDNLRIDETTNFMGTNLYDADGNVVKKANVKTNYILSLLQSSGISVIDYNSFGISSLGIAFDVDADDPTQYKRSIGVSITRDGTYVDSEDMNTQDVIYTYALGLSDLSSYAKVSSNTYEIYYFNNLKPITGRPYSKYYYGRISYLQLPFNIELRFGDGASDLAVGFLDESKKGDFTYIPVTKWHGHYINVEDFTVNGKKAGEVVADDLSGTRLSIPANQKFLIYNFEDFTYNKELIEGSFVTGYFTGGSVSDFNITIPISYGLFSKQFIPDTTIYQLLQTLAAFKQRLLYFDGSKYTTASVSDISSGNVHVCKDVIAGGYSITDKAFDFAQHNYVDFKSGGNKLDYTTNNVHLSEEKTLLTIPFDGGYYAGGGDTTFKPSEGFPAIGAVVGSALKFSHISKVAGFDAFLQKTRQVKVKFRMSYLDFVGIKELGNFEYKGARLQWSSIQWSDGWCTATLQTLQ